MHKLSSLSDLSLCEVITRLEPRLRGLLKRKYIRDGRRPEQPDLLVLFHRVFYAGRNLQIADFLIEKGADGDFICRVEDGRQTAAQSTRVVGEL